MKATPTANQAAQSDTGLQLLLIALIAAVILHGGLMPFTHGQTYDAFIHMFFADSYHRSWFDPWEPRWYTGFMTTSYPPGTHMLMALLMNVVPLRVAFVIVQITGLLLLVVGVFRFSRIWVASRPAGFAALSAVLASSIAETIHLFGQLPTIFSLGLFLNGLPYFFNWILAGKFRNLFFAVAFSAGTTAAHHVTTIFGGILFVLPVAIHALVVFASSNPPKRRLHLLRFWRPLLRGGVLAVLMAGAVAITVFPYWFWSLTDPITQVPIPHGSRESFLVEKNLGLIFFIIPWGLSLLILPYAFYKTFTSSLWPLGLSLFLCFVLGTGGTTPIPRILLGGAFDILTLDRFTFWGSILILPFTGLLIDNMINGRMADALRTMVGVTGRRVVIGTFFLAMAAIASFVSILTTIRPTQPDFIDPDPIVAFLQQDEHYRWRYLTLGFGDQFAYLSSKTTAQSVDGNYHSARRLTDLTQFSVERLENAKYLGVPGLGSLTQFVVNADKYHLKFIFSNDEFYDPLLHFHGWNRLNRLENGIVVWERPDVAPLPLHLPRRFVPPAHAVMWGVVPISALVLAFSLMLFDLAKQQQMRQAPHFANSIPRSQSNTAIRLVMTLALTSYFTIFLVLLVRSYQINSVPKSPEEVVTKYFELLDFRKFDQAYDLLDPLSRPPRDEMLVRWNSVGGLIGSYAVLDGVTVQKIDRSETTIDFDVTLNYLTGLNKLSDNKATRVVARDGEWRIIPNQAALVQSPLKLYRTPAVEWKSIGKRQPFSSTNLRDDVLDRPKIAIQGARIVEYNDRVNILGQVTNLDYDPAALTVEGTLRADQEILMQRSFGKWGGHRLLTGETAGFRIEFDAVFSIQDGQVTGNFDPTQFLPTRFEKTPDNGTITARALVNVENLYRGIALANMEFNEGNGVLTLSGLASNVGTETATVVRINVTLYDAGGQPQWVDAGFVERKVDPFRSENFSIVLPIAESIKSISDVPAYAVITNGRLQEQTADIINQTGIIDLNGLGGYAFARVHVSAMIHEPLF